MNSPKLTELKNIMLHELAHVPQSIEYEKTGKQHVIHGKTFKEKCKILGIPTFYARGSRDK